jgi:hypothetical protein
MGKIFRYSPWWFRSSFFLVPPYILIIQKSLECFEPRLAKMMSTKNLLATLLLAGTTLAKSRCLPKGDCCDASSIADYSTLSLREVGARNTLVRIQAN